MSATITPLHRTLFGALAVLAATLALSFVACAFLPAEPHVDLAWAGQAVDRARETQPLPSVEHAFRTKSVRALVH